MSISLATLRKMPETTSLLADAAKRRAEGSANAMEELEVINASSTWKGQAGDAGRDALYRRVINFSRSKTSDKNLESAATAANQHATQIAARITALEDNAKQPPYIFSIDEDHNSVDPDSSLFSMSKEEIHKGYEKYNKLCDEVASIAQEGDKLDTELSNLISTGTAGASSDMSNWGTPTVVTSIPPPGDRIPGTGFWTIDKTKPMNSAEPPVETPGNYSIKFPPGTPHLEGAPTGNLTIAKNWIQDPPLAEIQQNHTIRVSGTEFTGQTKMVQVDGKWYQAEWQNYTYDIKIDQYGKFNHYMGDVIPGIGQPGQWQPTTYHAIMDLTTHFPTDKFYIPDTCGNNITVMNGHPIYVPPMPGAYPPGWYRGN